jgi:hypothetical protein
MTRNFGAYVSFYMYIPSPSSLSHRIVESQPFTFLIGPLGKPGMFKPNAGIYPNTDTDHITNSHCHSNVFASISGPLDRMINGNLHEAHERVAEIPDMAQRDFIRLFEYAYRGKYGEIEILDGDDGESSSVRFEYVEYMFTTPRRSHSGVDSSIDALAWDVMLIHARMYCIGDRYLVNGLQ